MVMGQLVKATSMVPHEALATGNSSAEAHAGGTRFTHSSLHAPGHDCPPYLKSMPVELPAM
jgi:hypothetical protein